MVPLTTTIHARPGKLSFDIDTAVEQLGPRAPQWAGDLFRKVYADTITPQLIVDLAVISAMLEDEGSGGDADVINRVVALLLGQPE